MTWLFLLSYSTNVAIEPQEGLDSFWIKFILSYLSVLTTNNFLNGSISEKELGSTYFIIY